MTDLPAYDLLLVQARAIASEERVAERRAAPAPNLRLRNTLIIGGATAAMGAYALTHWWSDGFTGRFRTVREGDFGFHTEFSGIDKLGHLYSNYFGVRVLSPFFEAVGNPAEDARKLAAFTVWGVMTAMEVGDGFSKRYRFSPEDFVANTAGALLGYALEANPQWDRLLDLRMSYRKTPLSNWDPFGDYAGQRYFLAVKAEGVGALDRMPLVRYLEFNVGYGVPGIDVPDEWKFHDFAQRRREVFFGVGLNLSRLLADAFYGGQRSSTRTQRVAERALDLVQLPTAVLKRRPLDVQGTALR